ncbi:uncharacterized protein [Notothenia coriiceps]|uniref:BEN domain-containing protein n=1 Tax=Notothenia coriiceps TaxID=8208 RepID=A0A6I9PCA5_9TELE|nr:PREDICTED: uncharacterized protein LOC104961784 [Notothenia coriiceps]
MTRINRERSKEVCLMRENGKSTREIQQHFVSLDINISLSALRNHFREKPARRTGPRKLHRKILAAIDDQTNNTLSAKDLQHLIKADFGVLLGLSTIRLARRKLGWKYEKRGFTSRTRDESQEERRMQELQRSECEEMLQDETTEDEDQSVVNSAIKLEANNRRRGSSMFYKRRRRHATQASIGIAIRAMQRSCPYPPDSSEICELKRRLSGTEQQVAFLMSSLEEMSSSLEAQTRNLQGLQDQCRLKQTPPAPQQLDASTLTRRKLFTVKTEESPPLEPAASKPAAPASFVATTTVPAPTLVPGPTLVPVSTLVPISTLVQGPKPVRGSLPDVKIRTVSQAREETLYRNCVVKGEARPEGYAAQLFMALTPFEAYKSWAKKTNWSGSKGKMAIPHSVKQKLEFYVYQRFPILSGDQWHRIRNKINERLRSPRKVDPEAKPLGFGHF